MEEKIISILSEIDHQELYGTLFYAKNSQKALVAVFHGMAEHRHRYHYFAEQLVNDGYVVLTCDHRGHGDSGAVLGYFAKENGWFVNLEDLHQLVTEAKKQFPKLPTIIFGHSMGTLFARSYLKRFEKEIVGMVLSGTPAENPLATIGNNVAGVIRTFKGEHYRSKLLDNMSFGSFNKVVDNPKTDFDWLSKNADNVHAYIADEKCGYIFTTRGFQDVTVGLKDVYSPEGWTKEDSNLPIAFFSGGEDPCSCVKNGFENAVEKLKSFGYRNVTSKIYPKLRHEILNEDDKNEVIKDIIDFMDTEIMKK